MVFRIKYGEFEIECDTVDEVKNLISATDPVTRAVKDSSGPGGRSNGQSSLSGRDEALLRELMKAGEVGVEASVVGGLLDSARGRGVPFALARWAKRVGLSDQDDNDSVIPARPGGKRGWRLGGPALAAARAMRAGFTEPVGDN